MGRLVVVMGEFEKWKCTLLTFRALWLSVVKALYK